MKTFRKSVHFSQTAGLFCLHMLSAVGLLTVSASALATGGSTIVLNCNGVNDAADIQTAVNAAPNNGTVQIMGTCDLAGGYPVFIDKSNLTITGNPNLNAMTVIKGTVDANGLPTAPGRDANGCYNNRAFFIASLNKSFSGEIKNVTIKNIHFKDQWSAIWIQGDRVSNRFTQTAGTICNGQSTLLNAIAKDITVYNNKFTNVAFGAQLFGTAIGIYVSDNTMDSVLAVGINMDGANAGGGVQNNVVVAYNTIKNAGELGISDVATQTSLIIGNKVINAGFAGYGLVSLVSDDQHMVALNYAEGAVAGGGFLVDLGDGFTLLANKGVNNFAPAYGVVGPADILFSADSLNNLTITPDCKTTVVNLGQGNTLLGQKYCK